MLFITLVSLETNLFKLILSISKYNDVFGIPLQTVRLYSPSVCSQHEYYLRDLTLEPRPLS